MGKGGCVRERQNVERRDAPARTDVSDTTSTATAAPHAEGLERTGGRSSVLWSSAVVHGLHTHTNTPRGAHKRQPRRVLCRRSAREPPALESGERVLYVLLLPCLFSAFTLSGCAREGGGDAQSAVSTRARREATRSGRESERETRRERGRCHQHRRGECVTRKRSHIRSAHTCWAPPRPRPPLQSLAPWPFGFTIVPFPAPPRLSTRAALLTTYVKTNRAVGVR